MQKKYLLYIDILGFGNLSSQNDEKVKEIYEIIDDLNVHSHDAFDTFVFSDTILVTNKHDLADQHSHEYHIMYSCEFVQDLLYRCEARRLDVPFRAILCYKEFEYYRLKNITCYHGMALIDCYKREKELNGVGLFIHEDILQHNRFFDTLEYNDSLHYVFLTKALSRYYDLFKGETPLPKDYIDPSYEFLGLPTEIDLIKKYYNQSVSNKDPKIRAKYLQTYQFYKSKYPIIMGKLETNGFSYEVISPGADWEAQRWK